MRNGTQKTHHFAVEGLHGLTETTGKAIGLHRGLLEDLLQGRVKVENTTGLLGDLGLLLNLLLVLVVGHCYFAVTFRLVLRDHSERQILRWHKCKCTHTRACFTQGGQLAGTQRPMHASAKALVRCHTRKSLKRTRDHCFFCPSSLFLPQGELGCPNAKYITTIY